ncbi:bifunctional adenosylcobinamide kinase/adenosylcobinamide-phosphate guanylyltransferase [Marinobacterium sediminicola]|uniref:Bifunctional adenosylcobalamin biosynthesis protein n=1 Tax=Marinobacterium sediminicola TaxID=518898 RepID=A0ABY1S2A9_9GAMM|nr:bifunctional adenosylcobinamide kinase/adenosylcobinamide-phosphate guanylyltransferase [Marinobacterium sediminicola]ULG69430.1 bifunctional adenosylcobinamide kinase/adenosylcobinamide-phosphate guanylyltransferase [Marinobacterium sediminicola]SMR75580.1 adenosylcobinamide kinase /adenosylcobinamide-phosphate guanylyltransferase [Marinobacterium sediminicola]
MIRLILGGARSGKSRQAEQLALASGRDVFYIATAQAHDDEMRQRIERHREERPVHWQTVEEPLELAATILAQQAPDRCLLIDCLTLWVTNQLLDGADLQAEREALCAALGNARGEVILVSNETGMGVVPMGELSRRFSDEAGWLNQSVAALADQVVLMVAGIPMVIKGPALEVGR